MNRDDRLQAADSAVEDRLRAAGNALREGSATQVDAAGPLRQILQRAEATREPAVPLTPSPLRPAASLLPPAQRLALAVNLLLVLALGVALVVVVRQGGDPGPPASPAPTAATVTSTTKAEVRTVTSVPEACLDAAELADDVISRLNRNVRDERLFLALRDYTIASQACRRAASP